MRSVECKIVINYENDLTLEHLKIIKNKIQKAIGGADLSCEDNLWNDYDLNIEAKKSEEQPCKEE